MGIYLNEIYYVNYVLYAGNIAIMFFNNEFTSKIIIKYYRN